MAQKVTTDQEQSNGSLPLSS